MGQAGGPWSEPGLCTFCPSYGEYIKASVESCWEWGWSVRCGSAAQSHSGHTEKGFVPSFEERQLPEKHR